MEKIAPATSLSSRWQRWGIPFLAFAWSKIVISLAALATGTPIWEASSYVRWDANHYLAIARSGYEFFSCAKLPGYNPLDWCGNTGWLPGYPYLVRWVAGSAPLETVAAWLSAIFFYFSLFVLWNYFLGKKRDALSVLALAAAAIFPGTVYFHAVFPTSLSVLCSLLFLRYFSERQAVRALLAGLMAGLAYSNGFLLSVVAGIFVLTEFFGRERARLSIGAWGARLLAAAGPGLGLCLVFLIHEQSVGVWNAFLKVQSKYGFTREAPLATLWDIIHPLFNLGHFQAMISNERIYFPALQSLTCFVFGGLAIAHLLSPAPAERREDDRLLTLVSIFTLVFWLFPHLLGNPLHSFYRGEASLLPAVFLLARLPARGPEKRGFAGQPAVLAPLALLLALLLLCAYQVARLFFLGQIV